MDDGTKTNGNKLVQKKILFWDPEEKRFSVSKIIPVFGKNIFVMRSGSEKLSNGREYDINRFSVDRSMDTKEDKQKQMEPKTDTKEPLPVDTKDHQILYKELTLVDVPEHTIFVPESKYTLATHNKKHLVLVSDVKHYLAGKDLSKKEQQIVLGSQIRLGKTETNPVTRKKYREAIVFRNNEWWHLLDSKKISVARTDGRVAEKKWISDTNDVLVLRVFGHIYKLAKNTKDYKDMAKLNN